MRTSDSDTADTDGAKLRNASASDVRPVRSEFRNRTYRCTLTKALVDVPSANRPSANRLQQSTTRRSAPSVVARDRCGFRSTARRYLSAVNKAVRYNSTFRLLQVRSIERLQPKQTSEASDGDKCSHEGITVSIVQITPSAKACFGIRSLAFFISLFQFRLVSISLFCPSRTPDCMCTDNKNIGFMYACVQRQSAKELSEFVSDLCCSRKHQTKALYVLIVIRFRTVHPRHTDSATQLKLALTMPRPNSAMSHIPHLHTRVHLTERSARHLLRQVQ
jgi:hypothetical protein